MVRKWWLVPVVAASGLWATPAYAADGAAVTTVARVVDQAGRPTFVEVSARTAAEERRLADSLPGSVGHAVETTATVAATPDDPRRPDQWSLDRLRADSLPAVDLTGQLVAIVDTGVDAAHEDFAAGQVRCDLGRDFVSGGNGCTDPEGHGTHVAGIAAAATNNGKGVASLASGLEILPVRVMNAQGAGTSTNIANGIVYAVDHGATVINVSAAGAYSAVYDQAVAYATARDVPVVAAAGNNGGEGNQALWPASSPGTIAVAATEPDGGLAPYSNTSGVADIAAPGSDIPGLDALTGGYVTRSGTSMAAPLVSASVALYRASHAGATVVQTRQALAATADDAGDPGVDAAYGAGVVDPYALVSDEVPTVTLSTLAVAKRSSITVRVTGFKPNTTVTVLETYRYARRNVFISKTVALGRAKVSRSGAGIRLVRPVQSAASGKLTVRGTAADGSEVRVTNTIKVG
ncbi:S8 family serine peptidase [Actinoplanes sp. RD1]|uniref:S8 family serine peptidase n=1 Tax=Actinoplanes sp. RD1 TaxID=3064538 RepID=UPI002742090E|nr:S8 family serine peptidase [Actinoplanes sp. RD1]